VSRPASRSSGVEDLTDFIKSLQKAMPFELFAVFCDIDSRQAEDKLKIGHLSKVRFGSFFMANTFMAARCSGLGTRRVLPRSGAAVALWKRRVAVGSAT
jgi:hypothetical protein